MGAKHQSAQIPLLKHNDLFLTLTSFVEEDKLTGEVVVPSIGVLNKWAEDLQKLNQTQPEHLLLPTNYKIVQRSLCGESLKLQIEYPCFQILLSEQLGKRRLEEKYLQEPQMWYLVYCLTQSALCCQHINGPIGDIRTQNIFLSQAGKLKILSRWSLPICEGLPLNLKKQPLCSPQQLSCLKKSFKQFDLPFILSQSFSIGMTILSAGTLQSMKPCYDYENFILNELQFNKILKFWHQNQFYSEQKQKKMSYSRQLKDIVQRMVEIEPQRRMTSLQVYDLLQPHRNQIMSLKSFQLNLSLSSSPDRKKTIQYSDLSTNHIHMLRSRKRSSVKGSAQKSSKNNSKIQVSTFQNNINNEYSFNSPPTFNAGHKFPPPLQPSVRRNKLITSSILIKQQGQNFK